jgi:hypothetical protein
VGDKFKYLKAKLEQSFSVIEIELSIAKRFVALNTKRKFSLRPKAIITALDLRIR